MKVDEATVEKFVDFCLRPDNIQDVAFGSRGVKLDDGASFYLPTLDPQESQSQNGLRLQAGIQCKC